MARTKAVAKTEKAEIEILTAEEIKKIDEAVFYINTQANSTAKSLIEIGNYLLKTFFNGDIKKALDRGPRKGISLRKIADHQEILHSFMTLSSSVKLAAQESLFKDDKYKPLTESHKLLLFKIQDAKSKKSYADKILKEKMTVRKLQETLIKAGYMLQRGRKELPEGTPKPAQRDPYSKFFAPIEKLAGLDFNFDNLEDGYLTLERITALQSLKDRIESILSKASKKK